ncbi:MAG TPA: hypothetical protein VGK30_03245 [Candidatus Binatia bacterium]
MSTILKALEELEQRAAATGAVPTATTTTAAAAAAVAATRYEQARPPRSLTLPVVIVLTAGSLVGMAYFALRGTAPETMTPAARPQEVAQQIAPPAPDKPMLPVLPGHPAVPAAPVVPETREERPATAAAVSAPVRVAEAAPRPAAAPPAPPAAVKPIEPPGPPVAAARVAERPAVAVVQAPAVPPVAPPKQAAPPITAPPAPIAAPPAPAVAPVPPAVAAAVAAPAAPPAAAAPVRAPAPAVHDEAPWGRVDGGAATTAERPAMPDAPQMAARESLPPPVPSVRTRANALDDAPRREAAVRPARRDPDAEPAPRERRPAAESSGGNVEVMSIGYAEDISVRTATLRIGGQPVTLHQGDSARGVEVQLILPHSVYLRRGRDIFAIDARR